MKIFLVTMKRVPDNHVSERMRAMQAEAEWKAAYGHIDESDESVTIPPMPARTYSWLKPEDDAQSIRAWREGIAERKAMLDRLGITISSPNSGEEESEYKRFHGYVEPTFACNGDQLLEILAVDDSITVKSSAPVASDSLPGIMERLDRLTSRLESIELPAINGGENIYNERCEVHMPGQALASYNETLLLEDSCTDRLQESLNIGWRVIACCPQPDNRRPDYILGRFNPTIERAPDGARRNPGQ